MSMRRATALVVVLLVCAASWTAAVRAQMAPVRRINAIGYVDFSTPPTFQVGDWVRYHVTGESELGMRDDYELTVVITGEELFWGDSCFWIETWTEPRNGPPQVVATLLSYSIFRDTAAIQHMQMYQRKQINELDAHTGQPIEVVMEPGTSMLKARNLFGNPVAWDVDTLGTDTIQTPVGDFLGRKVSIRTGTSTTRSFGDSSRYDEARENRMVWRDVRVPITHVARESVENVALRRTWMIGRSGEGSPLLLRDRGLGSARLVATGTGGEPRITPPGRRMPRATAQQAVAPGGSKRR